MENLNVYGYKSYRKVLADYLQICKQKNSAMSLRAVAQKLDIPAPFLSEIIKGKKSLSIERAQAVCQRIGIGVKEQKYFLKLVELENSKSIERKKIVSEELDKIQPTLQRHELELKKMWLLEDPFCIPVMEMVTHPFYEGNIDRIAFDIGLAPTQVKGIVDTLVELKVVSYDGKIYLKSNQFFLLSSQTSSMPLKRFHSKMLEKAQRAIFDQDLSKRYTASETLMVDPSQISDANKIINQCLDDLVDLFSKGINKSVPYHVQVNLFSLKRKIVQEDTYENYE